MINCLELKFFPTTVMVFDLSHHNLSEYFENLSQDSSLINHGLIGKGKSSYGSDIDQVLDLEDLQLLKKDIQECIDYYSYKLGLQKCHIVNSWFNTMSIGGNVVKHRHEASIISGAYYPKAEAGSVALQFDSPTRPYKMCEIHEQLTEYTAESEKVDCIQGQLVLFPSYLDHFSETNETEERITVSFNTIHEQKIHLLNSIQRS